MRGYSFSKRVRRANAKIAFAIFEAEVLWLAAEDCTFVNYVVRTKRGEPLDHRVGANFGVVANLGVRLDDCEWSDGDSGPKPRC